MGYKLHKNNFVRVHDKKCLGCKRTGSDFMLSLGGKAPLDILDGNNEKSGESGEILDIFMMEDQAFMLYKDLEQKFKSKENSMTMEIEVKNVSANYVAEVTMMDQFGNPAAGYDPIVLKPGEYTTVTVWDGHWPAVKEIREAKAEDLEAVSKTEVRADESDEDRLYREKEMKVEDFAGGFMLCDYSEKRAPGAFCGESMEWNGNPIINDPFVTREEAVKAGLAS